MKTRIRLLPVFFGILGTLCAAGSVTAVLRSIDKPPLLVEALDSASDCAQRLMQSICQGNYVETSKLLLGQPDLELNRAPQDPVGVLLWDAYTASCSYTLEGSLYATETGLAQDVRFEALDLEAVLESMNVLAKDIFTAGIESAEDTSAIYDKDGNYREDFINDALLAAARQALQEHSHTVETELTLQLSRQDGQWLVTADQALLRVICGGIAG